MQALFITCQDLAQWAIDQVPKAQFQDDCLQIDCFKLYKLDQQLYVDLPSLECQPILSLKLHTFECGYRLDLQKPYGYIEMVMSHASCRNNQALFYVEHQYCKDDPLVIAYPLAFKSKIDALLLAAADRFGAEKLDH